MIQISRLLPVSIDLKKKWKFKKMVAFLFSLMIMTMDCIYKQIYTLFYLYQCVYCITNNYGNSLAYVHIISNPIHIQNWNYKYFAIFNNNDCAVFRIEIGFTIEWLKWN